MEKATHCNVESEIAKGKYLLKGTIIHSISQGEIEIIEKGAIVFQGTHYLVIIIYFFI